MFQINSIHVGSTAGCPGSAQELLDATTNAQCALGVFNIQGLDAWVAYKSHRAECDAASAPAADPSAAPAADANASPSTDPNAPPSDPCATNPGDPACQGGAGGNPWGDDPCIADPSQPACQPGDWGQGPWFSGRRAQVARSDGRRK